MTVTRVLANFPHVSQKTRKKVLQACQTINYRPNIIASSLRSNKSLALGVIVPTFKHTFYARFLNQVEEECKKAGYHIIVVQGRKTDNLISLEWADLEFLLARQIEGLLIDLELPFDILRKLKKEKIPLVFIDVPPANYNFPFVGTADFEGGKEITSYLIKRGHRKIVFLAGLPGHYTSERRLEGYKSALSENNIGFSKKLVEYTDYSSEGSYLSTVKMLSKKIKFTAIVGANDYVAIGALSALNQRNIKVPDEISVVGFTGDEIGAYTIPPLTTMVQPIEKIGIKAVNIILANIQDRKRPSERILLSPTLLERQSVKKI